VRKIQEEVQRRDRIAVQLTGKPLYLSPGTARAVRQQQIDAKRREAEGVAREIGEQCNGFVEIAEGRARAVDRDSVLAKIRQADEAARSQLGALDAEMNSTSLALSRIGPQITEARRAMDRARFALPGGRTLAQARTELTELRAEQQRLGPQAKDVLTINGNDPNRLKVQAEHEQRKARRGQLVDAINSLQTALGRYDDAARTYGTLQQNRTAATAASERAYRAYLTKRREHLDREAAANGWDIWWLRYAYPELYP
jgi:hypothetical protein